MASYDSIERQFIDAIASISIDPPKFIVANGQEQRFKAEGDRGAKTAGWYVTSSGSNIMTMGNWRTGYKEVVIAKTEERFQHNSDHVKKIRQQQEKDAIQKKLDSVKFLDILQERMSSFTSSGDNHPYLLQKKVKDHGLLITSDNKLVIPLIDHEDNLATVQYVYENQDGEIIKQYQKGLGTSGVFFRFFSNDFSTIYVCEGYATGASIFESTGKLVYSAMNAGNIGKVSDMIRNQFGVSQKIVIVADNDASNTGKISAEKAAKSSGASVVMIPILGMDANDYVNAGHDLKALLTPPTKKKFILSAADFISSQSNFKWIIKNFIQEKGLAMCHGASGSGKTFIVLDMIMRMTTGKGEWFGNRIKNGSVLYAAGEGHSGLKKRIMGWAQENKTPIPDNLFITTGNCDLDKPEGFEIFVDSLRELPEKPSLVVIDTLHRFLSGDENSAQDARIMIDSCNKIIGEFGCAVLLVHHTGVSEEAQHRGRGSSAWRAALDNEFNVLRDKEGRITISQKKSKDDNDNMQLSCELRSINIDGEYDDDGDLVTTAVVDHIQLTNPIKEDKDRRDSKESVYLKMFENAWLNSEQSILNGRAFITRESMKEYLEKVGYEDRTVRNMLNASYTDKLIGCLTLSRMIEATNNGWMLLNQILSSRLLLQATKG